MITGSQARALRDMERNRGEARRGPGGCEWWAWLASGSIGAGTMRSLGTLGHVFGLRDGEVERRIITDTGRRALAEYDARWFR